MFGQVLFKSDEEIGIGVCGTSTDSNCGVQGTGLSQSIPY